MTEYECLECPQLLEDVERGSRVIEVDEDADEPLFCPWCGNQSLIEGGVDWDE